MKLIPITAKEAKRLTRKLGLCWGGEQDGKTFYATNEAQSEVWEYDTKAERDRAVKEA